MVSWPVTALSDSRRSYRLCTRRDIAPQAVHAAPGPYVLARMRTHLCGSPVADRAARDILNDDGCLAGTYPHDPGGSISLHSPLRRCRTTFSWEPRSVIRACR
jgi:hypothetical protein